MDKGERDYVRAQLEPRAVAYSCPLDLQAKISLAISLRRIADWVEKVPPTSLGRERILP